MQIAGGAAEVDQNVGTPHLAPSDGEPDEEMSLEVEVVVAVEVAATSVDQSALIAATGQGLRTLVVEDAIVAEKLNGAAVEGYQRVDWIGVGVFVLIGQKHFPQDDLQMIENVVEKLVVGDQQVDQMQGTLYLQAGVSSLIVPANQFDLAKMKQLEYLMAAEMMLMAEDFVMQLAAQLESTHIEMIINRSRQYSVNLCSYNNDLKDGKDD